MSYSTGYFGVPGSIARRAKVHIVEGSFLGQEDRAPVCKTKISDLSVYQWCAGFIHTEYLECKSCKKWYNRYLDLESQRVLGSKIKV